MNSINKNKTIKALIFKFDKQIAYFILYSGHCILHILLKYTIIATSINISLE